MTKAELLSIAEDNLQKALALMSSNIHGNNPALRAQVAQAAAALAAQKS